MNLIQNLNHSLLESIRNLTHYLTKSTNLLLRIFSGKANFINNSLLFVELFVFISTFILLVKVYNQDVERAKILAGVPVEGVVLDKNAVTEREKDRKYSFLFCMTLLVILWISKKIFENFSFLAKLFLPRN